MKLGKLYLIPSLLGPTEPAKSLPTYVLEVCNEIDFFVVEKAKSARRYLRSIGFTKDFDQLGFVELNKRTTWDDKLAFIQEAVKGKNIGVISEAGCPGVADPGADMVKLAHEFGIEVEPLVGPSSLLLALMGSGLNGQSFAFIGYLPRESKERSKQIQHYERLSKQLNQTQLFIETPYRNHALLEDILKTCRPDTLLNISANLTLPDAYQVTKTIEDWKSTKVKLDKKPTVFCLLSA